GEIRLGLHPRRTVRPSRRRPLRGATQRDQLLRDDLRRVPCPAGRILPATVLEAPVRVDPVSLPDVPLDAFRQTVPGHNAVPLGLLVLAAAPRRPAPARRQRKTRDAATAGRRPDLRVRADVADQHRLVETPAHRRWTDEKCPGRLYRK